MPVNRPLLREIADAIEENPDHYIQENWVRHVGGGCNYDITPLDLVGHDPVDCGSACCIAGWAIALTDPTEYSNLVATKLNNGHHNEDSFNDAGRLVLGLTDTASALFEQDSDVIQTRQYETLINWERIRSDWESYGNDTASIYPAHYRESQLVSDQIRAKPSTMAAYLRWLANRDSDDELQNFAADKKHRREWLLGYESLQ